MRAIRFFQFLNIEIFNAVHAGTELGLATPLTTNVSIYGKQEVEGGAAKAC